MPARKPTGLQVGHDCPDERSMRTAAEEAMSLPEGLPEEPPARLNGHPGAQAEWRRLIGMYNALEGRIVGALDVSLLVNYCITEEQCQQLDQMRARLFEQWERQAEAADKAHRDHLEGRVVAEVALEMVKEVGGLYNTLLRLDARVDRKRGNLLAMQERMYLTPRARAAVTPESKKPEEPESDMEKVLNDQPSLL
ncbi:MAG: hypothetical protein ACYC6L_08840 [Anaerolineae bacterium]